MRIVTAETVGHWRVARELLQEYASALPADLAFQDFDEEIGSLPAHYSCPHGHLLLAELDERFVGCVGLRRLDADTCEMKRLYVRPEVLGRGLGRALAEAIIDEGRASGYDRMRLDTWPSMVAARSLYAALGFREIPPYRFNPDPGTVYLELPLRASESGSPGRAPFARGTD